MPLGDTMGQLETSTRDLATRRAVNDNMTAVNQVCGPIEINGPFLVMANTSNAVGATLTLEMSVDGGANWVTPQDEAGIALLNNVAPPINRLYRNFLRSEDGLLFRLRLTAITSGTVSARLSSGGAV